MASLRTIVVDDEPLAIERLSILLRRSGDVTLVGTASGGQEALTLVSELAPDLCFLDIGMPVMDGIEVARACATAARPPRIVFVTAFDRFAVSAFDLDAVDYLVKPVDPARLERALERARRVAPLADAPRGTPYLKEFWASDHNGLTRISTVDIDRITAERDYMRLHVGSRSWLVNDSLSRLEGVLDPAEFVRLHRGTIVQTKFVSGLHHDDTGWIARLADGTLQRVGRTYADNARRLSGRGRPPRS